VDTANSVSIKKGDIVQTQNSGLSQMNTIFEFPRRFNASGLVDAADVSIVRQQTLTSLP
jgi:hypothetical protein